MTRVVRGVGADGYLGELRLGMGHGQPDHQRRAGQQPDRHASVPNLRKEFWRESLQRREHGPEEARMERRAMRIPDDTLEDLLGAIGFACGRAMWPDEVDQRVVDEIVARIDLKLQRNRNPIRVSWFQRARDHAVLAAERFTAGDFDGFEAELRAAEDLLRHGNKAHRRRVDYVAGPDGQTRRAGDPP